MLSAAQLLDELMGRDRDLDPNLKRNDVPWDHGSVCKFFLCAFCPAELFTNTRSDLGPCEKIHDEGLRKQYEESSRYLRMGYERDFVRYLQGLLVEVERRIRRAHERVALFQSQEEGGQLPGPSSRNEKVRALTDQIDGLLEHIEGLGSEGKVEEAQEMAKRVEKLKREIEYIQSTPSVMESLAALEKPMEVCEICGAFLIVGDKQARVDDHFMGKRHLGYARIKKTIAELKEKLRKRSEEPERLKKDKERDERERDREEERKRRRGEDEKENGSKRPRERERRERSGSRGRRSVGTSDQRGSGSRDRRRSRSRERRRSRSRDRRSREQAERKRRSRSRERRPQSRDRRSYRNQSESRESEQEKKPKDDDKRSPEEKRNGQSTSQEKLSEVSNSDPVARNINSEVNGTCTDVKSEGELESDEN